MAGERSTASVNSGTAVSPQGLMLDAASTVRRLRPSGRLRSLINASNTAYQIPRLRQRLKD
jgi:hypothetical protein